MTFRWKAAGLCASLILLVLSAATGEAHKGATSKFTYNAEVYPIFLKRCGQCHIDGGVGPMSLLKYEDAFPWAEALRAELTAAASGDPHDFVKAAHRQISARELDVVLDWAAGGTPRGDVSQTPTPPTFENRWAGGEPAAILPMPAPFELAANALEGTHEFSVPVPVERPQIVTKIDVLPGNPAIVRHAAVSVRSQDGATQLVATWVPRQNPSPIELKPPLRIEPNSTIVARLTYKKTWKYEGEQMIDRSSLGLYFAD